MKLNKTIPILFFLFLFFQFPTLAQTDSWKRAYTDIELNLSNKDVTLGLAGGFKINRFVGFGLKYEESTTARGLRIWSLNFRGTNFKKGDCWGIYYNAALGRDYGHDKVLHYDFSLGVRYERFGVAAGLYDDFFNVKITQLFGEFEGMGSLLTELLLPTFKEKYRWRGADDQEGSSKQNPAKYLNVLLGVSSVKDDLPIRNVKYGSSPITYNLAGGIQFHEYLGLGFGVHFSRYNNTNSSALSFVGYGLNINGYPDIFFYNATLGFVGEYKLIDDQEWPGKTFDKSKGAVPFFEIKGGVRLYRQFSLGVSYFVSSKIKGNFKEYDKGGGGYPSPLIIDETRRTKFSGVQVFFGITI